MSSRPFALFLALTFLASGCSHFQAVPPEQRRAVVLSFDGAGERVIERMLDRGVMPNLARLRAEGVMADYSLANFPSKTAAGHAALWTGAYGNVNGITANKVPLLPAEAHSITENQDGFASTALLAEPIFVTAARSGKRALVLQATHESPFSTFEPGGRFGDGLEGSLTLLDGYDGIRGKEGHFKDVKAFRSASGWSVAMPASVRAPQEVALHVGQSTLWGLVIDDPADGTQGYDTLRLHTAKDQPALAELKPAGHRLGRPDGWSGPIPVRTDKGAALVHLRLFELDPKLGHWLLFHHGPSMGMSNKPEAAKRYFGTAEFVPGAAIRTWASGAFGRTMFQGGDGLAEDRYLDTVAFALESYRKRIRVAMQSRDWDLLINYTPLPDEALHAWYGAVDDQSPSYDPQLAPVVWKRLETVCRLVDAYLGDVLDGAGRDTVVAVASDHGMTGLKWKFHLNVPLREAGLLALKPDGRVDLARTQVLYAPNDGGYLMVNHVGRKGGIVPKDRIDAVLAKAQAVLAPLEAHDGLPVVTRFLKPDAENAALGVGGPTGGELYLDLRPGYYFDADWKGQDLYSPLEPGSAGHVFDPRRPDMHAIQAYWGPGVKKGVAIGPVRNIDLAPTVARLLGMPAPANATGRVLSEVLE